MRSDVADDVIQRANCCLLLFAAVVVVIIIVLLVLTLQQQAHCDYFIQAANKLICLSVCLSVCVHVCMRAGMKHYKIVKLSVRKCIIGINCIALNLPMSATRYALGLRSAAASVPAAVSASAPTHSLWQ